MFGVHGCHYFQTIRIAPTKGGYLFMIPSNRLISAGSGGNFVNYVLQHVNRKLQHEYLPNWLVNQIVKIPTRNHTV